MENEVAVLVNENEVKDHRKEYFEQIKNNGKYEINKELATALLAIEFGNKNIIISGSAGTGKSTFIELFQEYTRKSYGLFAPTGVASLNIGGVTLHSFFGLSIGIADKFDFNRSDEKREIINKLDVFIIDEISMVRSDVIDAIDYQLKYFTGNFDQPFGGKKMVFIGDLFQLPPIVQKGTLEEKIILEAYSTPWFFGADIGEFVFIIFDVESALMFPVAVVYRRFSELGAGASVFFSVLIFIGVLVVGTIYCWSKGDLDWVRSLTISKDNYHQGREQ